MRAPSSRVMHWSVCSSGRSVIMYVEPFERETSLVCTLRLSNAVHRALAICAVISRSSSWLGLCATLLAWTISSATFAIKGLQGEKRRGRRIAPAPDFPKPPPEGSRLGDGHALDGDGFGGAAVLATALHGEDLDGLGHVLAFDHASEQRVVGRQSSGRLAGDD